MAAQEAEQDQKPGAAGLRAIAYDLLGDGQLHPRGHAVLSAALLALIVLVTAAAAIQTLPGLKPDLTAALTRFHALAALGFSAEYLARLWTAPEIAGQSPMGRRNWRLAYAVSFPGIVDLLVILPFWAEFLVPVDRAWAAVANLLALLKLARYTPGLGLVAAVVRNEARALYAGLIVLLVMLVLASGTMYALEHKAQPEHFASIVHALWWGIVTMGTVGYGDVVPVTLPGRVVAGLVMVLGIGLFALPAGILATGFSAELRRRDFLITWRTVAKVPLFFRLDAAHIATIARLLKVEMVPAFSVIVRRGEPAGSMYFIMAGEVEVDVQPQPVRLKSGQYFGEIALLKDTVRTATVTAIRDCRLLSLDAADFRRLMAEHPELGESVTRVADARLKELEGR